VGPPLRKGWYVFGHGQSLGIGILSNVTVEESMSVVNKPLLDKHLPSQID
jgi:hypothetical protein